MPRFNSHLPLAEEHKLHSLLGFLRLLSAGLHFAPAVGLVADAD